jgi:hypothetical protein
VTVRLRPATANEWDVLLRGSPADYALAHTFEFGRAIASAYSGYTFEPRLGEFEDGTIVLWPLVRLPGKLWFLRRFEAMPLSLNGLPVVARGELTSRHLSALISALGADSLELNSGALDNAPTAFPTGSWEVRKAVTHVLDLRGGWDAVWETRFSNKVRNQCRMAWKKGVAVRVARGAADFESYYQIYCDSTRRWGYIQPPYPFALFQALAGISGPGVELKLGLVDGQPIAGIVLMHGCRSTLYWSGAMLKEAANYSVNNALLEVAIREACERGAVIFDFGASGELESVREFKERFGAVATSYESLGLQSRRHSLLVAAARCLRPFLPHNKGGAQQGDDRKNS